MKFVAYIDREGDREWPPRDRPPGESVTVEVTPETTFADAVAKALRVAGRKVRKLYFYGGAHLIYSPRLLRKAEDPGSGLLPFPKVAIATDGQFLWTWGARGRATFADYVRARDAGYFEGDPYGVFLERPMYGDGGVLPGWEELIRWLEEAAVVGMGAWLITFIRTNFPRWRDRGASTPYTFLDIVLARKAWNRADLSRVLGISEQEAVDLLTSLGFEPIDQVGRSRWVASNDPDSTALRRKILRDFMHHAEADDDESAGEETS